MSLTFELNNLRKDSDFSTGKISQNSPIVEIFSAMTAGKNLSDLKLKDTAGSPVNVDEGVAYIKELARQAGGGNTYAAVELNELRTFTVWPLLQEELKLLGWMGTYTPLGYNDTPYGLMSNLVGEKSRFQALNGDVVFPAWEYEKYPVATVSISGGYQVDYRKIQFGDMTDENIGIEQVRIDIRNRASMYVLWVIYDSISNAKVKFTAVTSGLNQTALDNIIQKVRRFGDVSVFGDYSVVSQINNFHGYDGIIPVTGGISQTALDELRRTGLIGMYKGVVVQEIKNGFNLTKPLPTGDGFETYFPQGLLFVIPTGMQSPVRSWTRGGLTSCQGLDVPTGRVMSRFDLEIGADVEKKKEFRIGMILDQDLGDVLDPRLN